MTRLIPDSYSMILAFPHHVENGKGPSLVVRTSSKGIWSSSAGGWVTFCIGCRPMLCIRHTVPLAHRQIVTPSDTVHLPRTIKSPQRSIASPFSMSQRVSLLCPRCLVHTKYSPVATDFGVARENEPPSSRSRSSPSVKRQFQTVPLFQANRSPVPVRLHLPNSHVSPHRSSASFLSMRRIVFFFPPRSLTQVLYK